MCRHTKTEMLPLASFDFRLWNLLLNSPSFIWPCNSVSFQPGLGPPADFCSGPPKDPVILIKRVVFNHPRFSISRALASIYIDKPRAALCQPSFEKE